MAQMCLAFYPDTRYTDYIQETEDKMTTTKSVHIRHDEVSISRMSDTYTVNTYPMNKITPASRDRIADLSFSGKSYTHVVYNEEINQLVTLINFYG